MHHLKDKQIEIINVGINLEDYEVIETKEELRKELGITSDTFVLLSVGRHVPRKKFDLVIKAVHTIKQSGSSLNLKYYLVGEGKETSNLKKLIKDLSLENEVILLGRISTEKRNKFFKLSDLFLMPSVTEKDNIEGFGIVFLEANYFKVPVIGSATGGVVDAIINKKTGFLVIPNNLEDLIEKILLLSQNKTLRTRMGEFGHQRVINLFTWDKIVRDYINLFSNLLDSKIN
jgi:phosphatidylinositol alpha-1,6-mannosyltransferase